jgi:hypothetical protein
LTQVVICVRMLVRSTVDRVLTRPIEAVTEKTKWLLIFQKCVIN